MPSESRCPYSGATTQHQATAARGNRDWWPEQLNLDILHQHSSLSNPMREDFNYAEEFKSLDLDSVIQDLPHVMTDKDRFLWPVSFSSNLARKNWRLEGNGETAETTAEETKAAKLLMDQDFPITLEDFS